MSERKVLSKYIPPDFDYRKIARRSGRTEPGPKVQVVRLMAPFSMQCTTCGEYIYKGRKFNARKETPEGEKYLQIQIFRFYIRCTRCSAEITFKTDPKNMDYTCEHGARRNFEPWRGKQLDEGETDDQRLDRLERDYADQDDRGAMEKLEDKTHDARREMDIADALDEIRTRNARRERVSNSQVDATDITAHEAIPDQATARQAEDEADAAAWTRARAEARGMVGVTAEMPTTSLPRSLAARTGPVKKQGLIKGIKKREQNDGASRMLVGYESDSDG